MKLRAIHLLLILIGSLIFCAACGGVIEGMSNGKKTTSTYNNYDDYYSDKDSNATNGSSDDNNQNGSYSANHTQYTGPAGDTVDVYSNDNGTAVVGPQGNVATSSNSSATATTYTGPQGNSATVVNTGGIYGSQIPSGDEDLYILKSQVVPPVCPACPTISSCPRQEPCPACPPCARCPEPSFECKKVPNYSANNDYLPRPVLSDFSQFGM